ncbi:C2 calcium-dependent domain-containing protein 6-like [Asterias rubens]|uniref:C2 calcium-dependent domain-containing protein 6-like n=1 Tax=Asterias rubens TaxID=7604 RepID=UPI00145563A6|nr:C2 calcium-dependent domain-containing protein 6-like [Asterias rubens]
MSSDESFDFIEEDDSSAEYVAALPSAVLSVHTKLLKNLDNNLIESTDDPELYIRIKVGSFIKSTATVIVEKDEKIVLDDLKHFSIKVSRKRSDPSNEVRFDLVLVESPHVHRIVGHKDMHLYDIIKSLYVAGSHDLQYRHKTIAVLDLEMCFTYGIFGYGCCHQLKNRQKKISDIVSHSLLLRVEPPDNRCQPNAGHVMTSMPIGHPDFINFTVKSDLGSSTTSASNTPGVFSGLKMQEPVVLTRTMRKRLNRIQTDFSQLGNRVQRKRFLERLILQNIHDHQALDTDSTAPNDRDTRPESSAGPGRIGEKNEDKVRGNDETYGTDSDYAESATDLNELMNAMLMNAPGLVSRGTARPRQPSLLSIGEENSDTDLTGAELTNPTVSATATISSAQESSAAEPRERRRSTLTELPGMLIRSVANRINSWKSNRNRPNVRETPVVIAEGQPSPQPTDWSSFSMARFRNRMAKHDAD